MLLQLNRSLDGVNNDFVTGSAREQSRLMKSLVPRFGD